MNSTVGQEFEMPGVRDETLDVIRQGLGRRCSGAGYDLSHRDGPSFNVGDCAFQKAEDIARRGHSPEQILAKLRQVEVAVASGKTIVLAAREAGITDQTHSATLRAGSTTGGAPSTAGWAWTRGDG